MTSSWTVLLRTAALASCLLVGLAGCTRDEISAARIEFKQATGFDLGKKPVNSRYLGATATKDGGEATVRLNREVRKPFRIEATLGLFDPKHADLGDGTFGISILEPGGFGAFFILQVRRSGAGIVVEARTTGPNPLATLEIPDSMAADVVLESLPASPLLLFSARRHGDAAYTPMGVAFAANGPFQPSLDIGGVPKKVRVGFDNLRVVTNGAATDPSPLQQVRETVHRAIDALLDAAYALDGADPDRVLAGSRLELAISRLEDALTISLDGFAKERKSIASALKKTEALTPGVKGTKGISPSLSKIRSAISVAGKAASGLR